jgi:hypothetical protein
MILKFGLVFSAQVMDGSQIQMHANMGGPQPPQPVLNMPTLADGQVRTGVAVPGGLQQQQQVSQSASHNPCQNFG